MSIEPPPGSSPQTDPMPAHERRIVALAFACSPALGSEEGAGWMWSRLVAGLGETVVITQDRDGSREAIEAALATTPERASLRFVFLEPPRWLRGLRRGRRSGSLKRLEFVAFLFLAARAARRLHRKQPFDLAWHLTWTNVWIGTTAGLIGPPLVYGPMGGGVEPSWRLVVTSGLRLTVTEIARTTFRSATRFFNPLARLGWSRAALILTQNPETVDWMPRSVAARTVVRPNAVLDPIQIQSRRRVRATRRPVALFAGRLLGYKGVDLAVRTIAMLPDWDLVICGSGPEESALKRSAERVGAADRIEFRGLVDRGEILRLMTEEADVLLFPSIHDDGPWVAAEAAGVGLPIVCLDRGAAGLFGGITVRSSTRSATVRRLAKAVTDALDGPPPIPAVPLDLEGVRAVVGRLIDDRIGDGRGSSTR